MLEERSTAQQTARKLEMAAADLFAVGDVTLGIPGQPETIRFRGRLRVPSDVAFSKIAPRFRALGYTAMLRDDQDHHRHILLAVPGVEPQQTRSRLWLNGLLYILTILSTLFVGATWSDQVPANADLGWILTHLWIGWPFALSLMTILTGHELGHYFAGRFYKVPVSLPFFIPIPVPPFGTMGAFIVMKGRTVNRRQMLTVGAAGPLVGFVLAVPILVLGLSLSSVEPMAAPEPGSMVFLEGNSILYLLLKFGVFGQVLPGSGLATTLQRALGDGVAALLGTFPIDSGYDVFVSPVALAGWAGLLVTALNLIPVGQLDGGHVLYSLVGQRAKVLTWPIIALLLVLGIVFWQGWLLWAFLIFFFGQSHPDPLDDVTRLDRPRKLVAIAVLLIFVLTFAPLPMRVLTTSLPTPASGQSASWLAGPGLVLVSAIWLTVRSRPRQGIGRPDANQRR
jgi:membrane-associated protease RseP (regulator of RpoE activity)